MDRFLVEVHGLAWKKELPRVKMVTRTKSGSSESSPLWLSSLNCKLHLVMAGISWHFVWRLNCLCESSHSKVRAMQCSSESDEPRSYSQKWQQAQNILLLQGWSASGTGHVSACMCTTAVCQGASTGGHRRVHQRGCRWQSQLEAEAVHQRFQAVRGADFQMDWWHILHSLGRTIIFTTIARPGPVVLSKTQCVCKRGPAVKESTCTSNRQKSCYKGQCRELGV